MLRKYCLRVWVLTEGTTYAGSAHTGTSNRLLLAGGCCFQGG